MKIIKTLLFIICFGILNSCGYKNLSLDTTSSFSINSINVFGDKKLAYMIKNNILVSSIKNSNKKYDIQIILKNTKNSKIKNSAGKTTRYEINISANTNVKDITNTITLANTFDQNTDYEVGTNYSDTLRNEKKALERIINSLSQEIINFIKLKNLN